MEIPSYALQQPKESNLNFNLLKSIVQAGKIAFTIENTSDSFYIAQQSGRPYIEPTLKKIEFGYEEPKIVLISAIGATGKTALARSLSAQTNLPIFDLAKHKPVGDNTLTGLLTTAFKDQDLSQVFQAIKAGSYAVIIDGIDEGRSKTNEKAFEAFLDDIIRLCGSRTNTSFILLGRSQVLEDCWLYLTDKNIPTNLIGYFAPKYTTHFGVKDTSYFGAKYTTCRC